MDKSHVDLRVALLVGTLRRGGAEKQLVYLARALCDAGVDVRVFCLTRGEHYESILRELDISMTWAGRLGHPIFRLAALGCLLGTFRPHVIQATHSYMNLYAALLGRACGAISIGAIRSSLSHTRDTCGFWTRWLVGTPTALVVNSQRAIDELKQQSINRNQPHFLLSNVIDRKEHDFCVPRKSSAGQQSIRAVFVGQLIKAKRVDRFLFALARAREMGAAITGMIAGDGPERESAESLAQQLGLLPDRLTFLGECSDVPHLLHESDFLVLCSDEEGSPNAILEAMAASLAVIVTPAGDAKTLVQDGVNGFLVNFGDIEGMAERMALLSRSPELRVRLGAAGNAMIETNNSLEGLAARILSIYRVISEHQRDDRILKLVT